jgi:hypothetical protein
MPWPETTKRIAATTPNKTGQSTTETASSRPLSVGCLPLLVCQRNANAGQMAISSAAARFASRAETGRNRSLAAPSSEASGNYQPGSPPHSVPSKRLTWLSWIGADLSNAATALRPYPPAFASDFLPTPPHGVTPLPPAVSTTASCRGPALQAAAHAGRTKRNPDPRAGVSLYAATERDQLAVQVSVGLTELPLP